MCFRLDANPILIKSRKEGRVGNHSLNPDCNLQPFNWLLDSALPSNMS